MNSGADAGFDADAFAADLAFDAADAAVAGFDTTAGLDCNGVRLLLTLGVAMAKPTRANPAPTAKAVVTAPTARRRSRSEKLPVMMTSIAHLDGAHVAAR